MADLLRFSVPCKPEYVGVVRLAVSSAANTAGFDIEEIEDIKIAVSEVCTSFLCNCKGVISYQVACELGDDKITISFDAEPDLSEYQKMDDKDGLNTQNDEAAVSDIEESSAQQVEAVSQERLPVLGTQGTAVRIWTEIPSNLDMGIMLLKALMDEVDIMSQRGAGTLIRMIKYFG